MSYRRGRRFAHHEAQPVDFTGADGSAGLNPDQHGILGSGLGTAGGLGIWSLLGALLARGTGGETLMLLLYGMLIESGRRIFSWLSERVLIKPSITAVFREGDPAYEWIMLYLTQENVWRKSRVFEVSAKSTKRKWHINASSYFPASLNPAALNADYVPNWSSPHMFSYRGYYVDVVKSGHDVGGMGGGRMGYQMYSVGGGSSIRLTFFTGLRIKMTVLSDFVEDCRLRYLESNRPRVIIHLSDAGMMSPAGEWGNVKTKTRRPLSTLALEEGVMDSLIQDVREFMDVEDWYSEAGIPHHRGYLLHGPPGTGKTSTIYALAGELGLEIYSLSLAASYIDDAYLQRLATAVPRGAILLIEDIDCAFPSREDEDTPDSRRRGPGMISGTFMPPTMMPYRNSGVTLSGLLNVIDGVGSDEGRLFFATTNHFDRLDPALVRPGRVDVKLEYKKAGQLQVRALFNRFFSPSRFGETSGNSTTPAASGSVEKPDSSGLRHRRGASGSFAEAPKPKRPLSVPLEDLANRFVRTIPEDKFSAAEIQGFLLDCKWDPEAAADGAATWVAKERANRTAQAEREAERKMKQKAKLLEESGGVDFPGMIPPAPGFLPPGGPTPGGGSHIVNGMVNGGHSEARNRGRQKAHPQELPTPPGTGAASSDETLNGSMPASSVGGESDDSTRTISTSGSFLEVDHPSPSLPERATHIG